MQTSMYLDEETNRRLSLAARERGESRNMLLLRAVREWLSRQDRAFDDHDAAPHQLHARPPAPTWQDSAIMS